jgi:hypothetical protein
VTRVEMVDPQGAILREIEDRRTTRDHVALTYAFCLRQNFDPACADTVDFTAVNKAILARWSSSALEYIKGKAWRLYEGRA